jgi:uncharacterized oligopeptide transporter (OPT) family protein
MKRTLLGAIVGGIIIFLWQFLSWGIGNFHYKAQQYTPNQEAIMATLAANLPEEGGYFLPTTPPTASREEMEKSMKEMEGKPWASIQYHKSFEMNMAMTITRQLIVDILTVWLFIWIIGKFRISSFTSIFFSSLAVGLIIFLNEPYTGNIWYKWFDIMAFLGDCIASWGLAGLCLAWLYNRKPV